MNLGNRKDKKRNLDYQTLIQLREEKRRYRNEKQNPFLISQPHTDEALYKALYKFDTKNELNDYLSPLEEDVKKKKKITKFDILMMNPKYLPKRKRRKARRVPTQKPPSVDGYQDNGDDEEENIKYQDVVQDLFKSKHRFKMEQIQNAVFEDNEVKDHLYGLITGEDAISFFAKYGNTTPIKFINCKRKESTEKFRPYDLVVIHEYEEVIKLSQYYTVSSSGIVRVFSQSKNKKLEDAIKSEESTEYISLSDWMKESTQFNIVSNIHYFKNYMATKLFKLWRSNVKYRKFCNTRQILVNNLFYCKPAFSKSVMQINQTLQDIHNEDLVNFAVCYQNTSVNLDRFKGEQKNRLTEVEKKYKGIVDKILRTFKQTLDDIKLKTSEKSSKDLDQLNFGKQVKQKAIYLQKLEAKEKKLRKKLAENDFRQSEDYVRLINYMVLENKVLTMNRTLDTLKGEICSETKNGLFTTSATFDKLQISFTLSDEEVNKELVTILEEIINKLQDLPGIIENSGIETQRKENSDYRYKGRPEVSKVIQNSVKYEDTKKKVEEKIKNDFVGCNNYVNKNYQDCIEIEEQKKNFQWLDWKEESHELPEIERKISKWKIYRVNKEKYIRDQTVGNFHIESKKIKTELTTFINTCMKTFKEYLKEYFDRKLENLSQVVSRFNTDLDKTVEDLPKLKLYCEFIACYDEAEEKLEFLEKEKSDIKGALKLLEQNKEGRNYTDEKSNVAGLEDDFKKFKEKMKTAKDVIATLKDDMKDNWEEDKTDLVGKIKDCKEAVMTGSFTDIGTPIETALEDLMKVGSKIELIEKKIKELEVQQKRMKRPWAPLRDLKDLKERFKARDKLWKNIQDYDQDKIIWFERPFFEFDEREMEKKFKDYENDFLFSKTKMHLFSRTGSDAVLDDFETKLSLLRDTAPIILALRNEKLLDIHYNEIWDNLENSAHYKNSRDFKLNDMIENGILDLKDLIEDISVRATGEADIKEMIRKIKSEWADTRLNVEHYRGEKDKFILTEVDEIYEQLDDHQIRIQVMLASKYVSQIRTEVEDWESKLSLVQNILEEWQECQRQWIYLENIFSADDIKRELPGETAKFDEVNRFWKDVMHKTHKKPSVLEACKSDDILERFQDNNKILEEVQRLLEDFLDKKRKNFPRFYFLTNDDLLEILSQTRNPHAVQPHLRKCFDNMSRIQFTDEEDSKEIIAMISAEPEAQPEIVPFSESIRAERSVEVWLGNLEEMMKKSLYDLTKLCLQKYPKHDILNRKGWFFTSPAQSVLVVDMIEWTHQVEEAFKNIEAGEKDALKNYYKTIKDQINEMVDLVKNEIEISQRETIKCLIILDVHNRNIVETLTRENITNVLDFEWAKQLRYYWDAKEDDVFARQTNTNFRYGYEYLGNSSRLVITPLTDKLYVTLTGALHLSYGGAPEGPAGTGKTETVKDLGKSMAVQCIVFNCSSSIDVGTMARFFNGLAQCGAWICLDEFNRIEIEVLSVVAQQILTIQNGIREKKMDLEFDGKIIPLNSRFGVFITMNPARYGARSELPDNLKALFRPVAVMVPDYAIIAEIILFSEGFASAQNLARKMVYLYKLSSQQLSKQDHYDFGLRAVKSVLVMAGSLRRKIPKEVEEREDPVKLEGDVLLKAMRDSNKPKFLTQDLGLFDGIIGDLFPGKDVPPDEYPEVKAAVRTELNKEKLQETEGFMVKVIQLLETMIVRHGVMTVGKTGTGKTMISKILAHSLTELSKKEDLNHPMFKEVKYYILNPKAITQEELFGWNDVFTNTFTHGIVSKLVNNALLLPNDIKKWLWFDGPADAGWIENLNTVLDDNRMLCLPDGKRIKLPSSFAMLFEVEDLANASLATVSRCGMVYLDSDHLGYLPVVDTWWLKFKEEEEQDWLEREELKEKAAHHNESGSSKQKKLFKMPSYFESIYELIKSTLADHIPTVRRLGKEAIPSANINLVQSCLNLFTVLYRNHKEAKHEKKKHHNQKHQQKKKLKKDKKMIDSANENFLKNLFIFSFFWSVGGNLNDQSRAEFNKEMRKVFIKVTKSVPPGSIYEHYMDVKKRRWEEWKVLTHPYKYNPHLPYSRILVDTTETARYKFLLKTLNSAGNNVLLMGETGVGKSVIVKDYLNNLEKESYTFAANNFSAQTSSKNIEDLFVDKLTQSGRFLGPRSGKKMIFFFDDINMPKLDKYGTQPPNEFLRQVIDQGGFYDLKKYQMRKIKGCCMVSACSPPGGGKNEVSRRLFRHFHMLWIPELNSESMQFIFKSILEQFLESDPITSHFKKKAKDIVKASVDIYLKVSARLLPTPSKAHYTFNLRDLSKVIQGVLLLSPSSYKSVDDLYRCWAHEECRIFHDRLVDTEDRDKFFEILMADMQKFLSLNWEKKTVDDLIFTSIIEGKGSYKEATDRVELIEKLSNYENMYNSRNAGRMSLTYFEDAVKHLCRIARTLSQPRGNVLLIGVGGSGRQSLTKIATVVNNYEFQMIEITKSYNKQKWNEDLISFLLMAGKDQKEVTFLFSDTQIIDETFLEDINNILNTGEVPNLLRPEDIDAIVEDLRPVAREKGLDDTKGVLLDLYVQNVKENLHIALTFSPVGTELRRRCLQFPSIINCCTIDWFDRWPNEALHSVAISQFKSKEDDILNSHLDSLCELVVAFHNDVLEASGRFFEELKRKYYLTPTSYLELINLYTSMFDTQSQILPFEIKKFTKGLEILKQTNEQVAEIKQQIIQFQPILKKAQEDNVIMKANLEKETVIVSEQEEIVGKKTEVAEKEAAEVNDLASRCDRELKAALPALQKAKKSAENMDNSAISEIKAIKHPTETVLTICAAVGVLFGVKDDWGDLKKMVVNNSFKKDLANLDPMSKPDKIWRKLKKKYLDIEWFGNKEYIESKSKASVFLADYLINMEKYYQIKKDVVPMEEDLKKAMKKKAITDEKLEKITSAFNEIQAKVANLEKKLKDSIAKEESLKNDEARAKKRLERAKILVVGLDDEAKRWEESRVQLTQNKTNLVGNMLVAAAAIAYLGPFTAGYRNELLKKWRERVKKAKVPISKDFSLESILSDPIQIREWQNMGLPADPLSIQNAILMTKGNRWPLLIDPQSQANSWIKEMRKDNGLVVTKLNDANFVRLLENAIRFGNTVVLENVEETLDLILGPILKNELKKSGNQMVIKLGDQEIVFNQDFRLYITTKLPNPHYVPEIVIKVTLINFTVTPKGLENQLLIEVIKSERNELEEQRDNLIVQISDYNKQLVDLQSKILNQITNVSGKNILDDEDIIITLKASKNTSETISKGMKEAQETTKTINRAREEYRPIAERGSILYFVIADLSLIDPMYQYSLEFFINLFKLRLKNSEQTENVSSRIKILISDITLSFYQNICRGLFEKHKLLFSFLIASQIGKKDKKITEKEWIYFMNGSYGDIKEQEDTPDYIPESIWKKIKNLESMSYHFTGLEDSFHDPVQEPVWRKMIDVEDSQNIPLPQEISYKFSAFQKLLIYYTIAPEQLIYYIKNFVEEYIGSDFIKPPPFDLTASYDDSTCRTPIIFILSSGADPMSKLLKFAKEKEMDGARFKILSLGQGQGQKAEDLIKGGRLNGEWVCLQNCHLAASWMTDLERIQENQAQEIHPDFRLWLTSTPTERFPVPVLQSGIKLTNEPPRSIKANLTRTYLDTNEEWYTSCPKDLEFRKLYFSLSLFHAVILERRKFGAIGWNEPYGWMNSDLETCQQQLKMYVEEQPEVPYETLRYLMAVINYGGRITDDKDERCIMAILMNFMCPDVMGRGYEFSESGTYRMPDELELDEVKGYIEELPGDDKPEVFGLHQNASITFEINRVKELMDTLIVVQPKVAGGGKSGESTNEYVYRVAGEFEKQLPQNITYTVQEKVSSLHVFRNQEIDIFNRMINLMKVSLKNLKRAIDGYEAMSEDLEDMYNKILLKKVPANWEKISYLSLKPLGSWFEDFLKRIEFMNKWVKEDQLDSYWVSAFDFTQGFMTAVLQTYARKTLTPVDELVFQTYVRDGSVEDLKEENRPEDGVNIHGMILEGCAWDRERRILIESERKVLYQPMPPIWIKPVKLTEYDNTATYACPVYKTTERQGTLDTTGISTNYVLFLDLPSEAQSIHWVRRGVAMVLQTDD